MVVCVGLAGMLLVEVLMRDMGMKKVSMVMLVLVGEAVMLNPAGLLVAIVGDVEVPVRMRPRFVGVAFVAGGCLGVGHDVPFALVACYMSM